MPLAVPPVKPASSVVAEAVAGHHQRSSRHPGLRARRRSNGARQRGRGNTAAEVNDNWVGTRLTPEYECELESEAVPASTSPPCGRLRRPRQPSSTDALDGPPGWTFESDDDTPNALQRFARSGPVSVRDGLNRFLAAKKCPDSRPRVRRSRCTQEVVRGPWSPSGFSVSDRFSASSTIPGQSDLSDYRLTLAMPGDDGSRAWLQETGIPTGKRWAATPSATASYLVPRSTPSMLGWPRLTSPSSRWRRVRMASGSIPRRPLIW